MWISALTTFVEATTYDLEYVLTLFVRCPNPMMAAWLGKHDLATDLKPVRLGLNESQPAQVAPDARCRHPSTESRPTGLSTRRFCFLLERWHPVALVGGPMGSVISPTGPDRRVTTAPARRGLAQAAGGAAMTPSAATGLGTDQCWTVSLTPQISSTPTGPHRVHGAIPNALAEAADDGVVEVAPDNLGFAEAGQRQRGFVKVGVDVFVLCLVCKDLGSLCE
jgi:hypothetical protein